jgi:nucleoside-diphosphate-sugar epimerase
MGAEMFAIVGITGQVGGIVARTLLDRGQAVRAVVRSSDKGKPWADKVARLPWPILPMPGRWRGALPMSKASS